MFTSSFAQFFDTDGTFLFATDKIASYEYTKYFSKVGNFSMVLPFDSELLKMLKINGVVLFDGDYLWIQSVAYNGQQLTISGKDCKGILDTRIALYGTEQVAGADGYDVVQGTTLQCIQHYLNNNCISSTDSNRNLPLIVKPNGAVGLQSDSFMARFQYLSEIVGTLCDDAQIGYDITYNAQQNKFSLSTIAGTDRSASVWLSAQHRNVVSYSFEHSVDNYFSSIYATSSSGSTLAVERDPLDPRQQADVDEIASGIARRECNVSVSVESGDEWFNKYALREVEDNVEAHDYEIAVPVSGGFGTDFFLGDTVTIRDDFTRDFYTAVISGFTKSCSQGSRSISLTLGQPKAKPIQKIVNNLLNKTQRKR